MRILTTREYERWLSKLKDKQAKARIILKTNQIQQSGIKTADFKHVGRHPQHGWRAIGPLTSRQS